MTLRDWWNFLCIAVPITILAWGIAGLTFYLVSEVPF